MAENNTYKQRLKKLTPMLQQNEATELEDELLQLLADIHVSSEIPVSEYRKIGQLLTKCFEKNVESAPSMVLICGQCTTTWLCPILTSRGWADGTRLRIIDANYDNVLQTLNTALSGNQQYDLVVLLPWLDNTAKPSYQNNVNDIIADQMEFWNIAWDLVLRMKSRLVQIGYDYIYPGSNGTYLDGETGGVINLVRELNRALRFGLPDGAYFVDLEYLAGRHGRKVMYDMRQYCWTRQPFSDFGVYCLANHIWAGAVSLLYGPKKVLVVDLDNTLWGGVVGELGALGIELGDNIEGRAHLALQKYILALRDKGILIAVASKNNMTDVMEVFRDNPDLLLRLEHFSSIKADWVPKSKMLKQIADELRLGLDSFVFLDDNPAERAEIRAALPMVAVVEVGDEPAEYTRALAECLYFESVAITSADRLRQSMYQQEQKRQSAKQGTRSVSDYLRSLKMEASLHQIAEPHISRLVQLVGKTNQFNLTTRRHTREKIIEISQAPRSVCFCLSMTDKFGDYGIVAILLAIPNNALDDELIVDTWLMSCRVLGRTVEQYMFQRLVEVAREKGFSAVIGEYIPTSKNGQVADLYPSLGFKEYSRSERATYFKFILNNELSATTFVNTHAG